MTPSESQAVRDWHVAVALGLAFFGLYLLTLCPTVHWYDSAEFATASATLGIPHPPGYPLYTLLGRVFVLLPVEPAYAVNLMSATFGAVTVVLCYATARELGAGRVASTLGATLLGAAPLFWSQAVVAEVYTPGLAFFLGALLLLLRGTRQRKILPVALAAGVAGLGLGAHLFIATCGLGFVVLVAGFNLDIRAPRDLARLVTGGQWRRRALAAAAAFGAVLLGASIFLWLPLRAAMGPELNVGDPSSWEGFRWVVTGGEYKRWFARTGTVSAGSLGGLLYNQLFFMGVGFAALGLWRLARDRALAAVCLLLMAAGNIWFFYDYKVHDWQVFFLPTVAVLCLLASLGAHTLLAWLAAWLEGSGETLAHRLPRVALFGFGVTMVVLTYPSVDMSQQTDAKKYGDQLCRELPPNARILHFTSPKEWKHNAVFANYYQLVLRRRRDVKVIDMPTARRTLRLIRAGVPVYVYTPLPRLRRVMELRREGLLWRLVGLRRRPPKRRARRL